MKRLDSQAVFPLLALVILSFALSVPLFKGPAIGKLLNPFTGCVQNDNEADLDISGLHVEGSGLSGPVQVYWDERKVPHIYAKSEQDLYFSQGYITARLRLWQMDFLTYVAAGRLSEIFDDTAYLTFDRQQRRIGLLAAARSSLKLIEQDSETYKVLCAYTKGVNAYICQLKDKNLPLEYKLMGYRPEEWTNLKSVLLLKYLGNTLTGYEEDMIMSKLILLLGEEEFNQLYPDYPSHISPVRDTMRPSEGTPRPRIATPGYLNYSFVSADPLLPDSGYNPRLGSNSWAVSGKKTRSGFPILACDPHLNLTLPSIWIEMQLNCPGMSVYGVSIPGTPAVIIGFNKEVAWGITNGADDTKDWYKLRIDPGYTRYQLDNKWEPLSFEIEEIKRRGQKPFYDTIYRSIQGPVVYDKSFKGQHPELVDYAMRWELLNPSNEFKTFILLDRAKDLSDYRQAISYCRCPTLNFTFACKDNSIAVVHQGNMAVKTAGQGKFILDGTRSALISSRYIPMDSLPSLINPASQFVFSANQHPTYCNYPYYYNGYYAETRANEIKSLLAGSGLDISRMESIQLNNANSLAVEILPVLLKRTDTGNMTTIQRSALRNLSLWKGTYDMTDRYAVLYDLWWRNIKTLTWGKLGVYPFKLRLPDDCVLADLIKNDPASPYFHRLETSGTENASDIITSAFRIAFESFIDMQKGGKSTEWGQLHKVNIMHLTNLPAFSCTGLASAGQSQAINAISANWGPSWRMIVELGPSPTAYGIYPGGQSGNPGGHYYDDFVKDWNFGKYYKLHYFLSTEEARRVCRINWILD